MHVWEASAAWTWYDQHPIPFGTNFVPSAAVNFTELWQPGALDPAEVETEIALMASTGFRSARIFLQFLEWHHDPDAFLTRMAWVLDMLDRHGITMLPVLLNEDLRDPYPGRQLDPIPGVHGSRSTGSPGPTIADDPAWRPRLQAYVQAVVDAFGEDHRIYAWDLYNEPGQAGRGSSVLNLLDDSFSWARQVGPVQPLTAGAWFGHQEVDAACIARSDIISFHEYADADRLRSTIQELKAHGRPVMCTEWMARSLESRIETHLPIFAEYNVGSFLWGLVDGRAQTSYPWNSEEGSPEPAEWFHDLYRRGGVPYREAEIRALQRFAAEGAR